MARVPLEEAQDRLRDALEAKWAAGLATTAFRDAQPEPRGSTSSEPTSSRRGRCGWSGWTRPIPCSSSTSTASSRRSRAPARTSTSSWTRGFLTAGTLTCALHLSRFDLDRRRAAGSAGGAAARGVRDRGPRRPGHDRGGRTGPWRSTRRRRPPRQMTGTRVGLGDRLQGGFGPELQDQRSRQHQHAAERPAAVPAPRPAGARPGRPRPPARAASGSPSACRRSSGSRSGTAARTRPRPGRRPRGGMGHGSSDRNGARSCCPGPPGRRSVEAPTTDAARITIVAASAGTRA